MVSKKFQVAKFRQIWSPCNISTFPNSFLFPICVRIFFSHSKQNFFGVFLFFIVIFIIATNKQFWNRSSQGRPFYRRQKTSYSPKRYSIFASNAGEFANSISLLSVQTINHRQAKCCNKCQHSNTYVNTLKQA